MPDVVQFVDSIASSPTVRLDLNDDVVWSLKYEDTDLSPPPLKVKQVSNLMADGEVQPTSVYGNRRPQLALDLKTSTVDGQGVELQKLWRELDRPFNFIKWQPSGTSNPVFFKTLRSMDSQVYDYPGAGDFRSLMVKVTAEPFAYGLKETLTPATVSNDPAAVSNGCFWDITGVKGDVQTPLVLRRPTTNVGSESLFAVRRRGTPSAAPFLLQCESMTQGTDTTTQPNSATFSGAGNNYSRISFATNAGDAARLTASPFPSTSVDARGTYRVFARVRQNGATSTIKARLRIAGSIDLEDKTVSGAAVQMVDMGLVSIPAVPDPVYDGPSGVAVPTRGISISLRASRTGGTDTLDVDYLLVVPADDSLVIVHWLTNLSPADRLILDGTHGLSYAAVDATGEVVSGLSGTPGYHVGGLPMLSPGVTNRIYHINEVGAGLAEPAFPTTWSFEGHYWPRYLHVRST